VGHSCAGTHDGAVWYWGRNTHGELGDGTGVDSAVPVPAVGIPPADEVVAGCAITCMRAVDEVWCWGYGRQTGDGTLDDRLSPVLALDVCSR
jgi:alpha-tubulin suppressor-like RCC1 family protein